MLFAKRQADFLGEVVVEVFWIEVAIHAVPLEAVFLFGCEALTRLTLLVEFEQLGIVPDAATILGRTLAFAFDEGYMGFTFGIFIYGREADVVHPRIAEIILPLDGLALFGKVVREGIDLLVEVAGGPNRMGFSPSRW